MFDNFKKLIKGIKTKIQELRKHQKKNETNKQMALNS